MLLEAGGSVTVVSPALCVALQRMRESGRIVHASETYQASHVNGARLVVAATDRPEVNEAVARDAHETGALLNDAGEPSRGDFTVPSTVRRGDLILTVTTVGGSPALAKSIRDELAAQYGPEWGPYVALLGEVRQQVLATVGDPSRRKEALKALAGDSTPLELIREGRVEEARARAYSCILPSSD